jgi:orotate phosphoribosyltransferase
MSDDVLKTLPVRAGHFLLESGYHADRWFTLDALFVTPRDVAPLVTALASRLGPYGASAVCGPLTGGAFLAQAVATALGVDFFFSEPAPRRAEAGLFASEYRLPAALQQRVHGARVALVDDVISAGSSVRATAAALTEVGASVVAVGTLLALGTTAVEFFAACGVPVEALGRRDFTMWEPAACPLCRTRAPLEDPIERDRAGREDRK